MPPDDLGPDEVDLETPEQKDAREWAEVRASWVIHLENFDRELYYPVFAKKGYSKNAALTIYTMRSISINNSSDDDDEAEKWKK